MPLATGGIAVSQPPTRRTTMDIYEMRRDVRQAKETIRNAESLSCDLISFLADNGRIRNGNAGDLAKMKAQLKDFNAHTGKWRDEA